MSRLHALVTGRVQGVGFRWFVRHGARGLGVRGWCANLEDGRVEVSAEGERVALDALLALLRRGPPGARVGEVTVEFDGSGGALAPQHQRIAF